jgi:hypothetical protein
MSEGGMKKLTVEFVWSDEHMIEVKCQVILGDWAGVACAYTTLADVQEFSEKFRLCGTTVPWNAEWRMIEGNAIRLYSVDRAGHMACHIHLATGSNIGPRPEQVWKLSAEMEVDPAQVLTFADDLAHMVVINNKAVLCGRL